MFEGSGGEARFQRMGRVVYGMLAERLLRKDCCGTTAAERLQRNDCSGTNLNFHAKPTDCGICYVTLIAHAFSVVARLAREP